jgi:hypothetical protein
MIFDRSRMNKKSRGFVGTFLAKGSLAEKMQDAEVAGYIAGILRPLVDEYKVGSPITGAQCEISHEARPLRPEDYQKEDYGWDNPQNEDALRLIVHLKSVESVRRFQNILPSVERLLRSRGFGCISVESRCDPKSYEKPAPYRPLLNEPREKNDEASGEARDLAARTSDPDLKKALERLADTLSTK